MYPNRRRQPEQPAEGKINQSLTKLRAYPRRKYRTWVGVKKKFNRMNIKPNISEKDI